MELLQIQAEFICEFTSFERWVNKAKSWIGGFSPAEKVICIDINGNACNSGREFHHARDNNLFPIRAYRLIKSGEE